MAMTLLYFTRELPGICEDLIQNGLTVYEALAISEVLYLAELYPGAHIVIDHTVEDGAANALAKRYSTLRLNSESTSADVIWELSEIQGARVH